MRSLNPELLNLMREPGPCDWCGRHFARRVPHHIMCKGMGNGAQMDFPANILRTGPPFGCPCHELAQRYKIPRIEVIKVVAAREGIEDWARLEETLLRLHNRVTRFCCPCEGEPVQVGRNVYICPECGKPKEKIDV